MGAGVITGTVTANAGLVLMARLRGQDGQLVTADSVSAIAWQATDLYAGGIAGSGTFTVASSLLGALQQNDPRWTADSAARPGNDGAFGYNFAATLPAATFPATPPGGPALSPAAARQYQIDVKFTATDGTVFYAIYVVQAIPVYF